MMHRPLLACLALVWLSLAATAQEWTRFRGPNGSGESDAKTIPVAWTDTDYVWQVGLPGIGHSSPVLWGSRLFVTSASPDDGTRHVLCFSASDGKQLWQKDFSAEKYKTHLQNSLASSTPAVDEGQLYFAWASGDKLKLTALKHDGNETWTTELGPFESVHGFGTSPIVYGDLVILADEQEGDSFMFGIERRTGQIRWKVPRKVLDQQNTSYAAPCVYRPAAGPEQLIVASWAHGVCSLNPENGKTNWEAPVLERRPVASPIIVEGLILANCGEGGGNNNVVAVRPPTAASGEAELIYRIDKNSAPYVPSLVAKGPLVFLWGDKGIVTCIDAATGKQRWRERVGGNYSSSPVRVADAVYCISTNGEVVSIDAADTFKVLGRSPLGEPSRATPAVADGRMFLRTESKLFAVGKR